MAPANSSALSFQHKLLANPLGSALKAFPDKQPPDVMEFVLSDKYLNRPSIYPRQALILKIMFLQDQLFTQYDYDVIGEWEDKFRRTGNNGCSPQLLRRIQMAKAEGRRWFRQTVSAIGRRGSKGYIGGLAGAYVLWHYHLLGDPQAYYGIASDKRLAFLVFGGKKEQAKTQQWRDMVNVILGAPCYSDYISQSLGESLTIYSPADLQKMKMRSDRGIDSAQDMASFEILPKESTLMAGRGPASFGQVYDEMAHVTASVGGVNAADVYEAATPSLDQFGVDGWIYCPSSPWEQTGKFYDLYQQALQEEEDGTPTYPDIVMFQLASWDPYEDWEIADRLYPTETDKSRTFLPLLRSMQDYDLNMQRLEKANAETFKVERLSHFATVLDAYLVPERVDEMFHPWNGETLVMKSQGDLSQIYVAHGDPSRSGANFGFAIAHLEPDPDGGEYDHIVFDYITHWTPTDFVDNNYEIDYFKVADDIEQLMLHFAPSEVSFDQFDGAFIQMVREKARKLRLAKRVSVSMRTATAPQNWKVAETFKTALGMGLVHAPEYELLKLELKFLQEKTKGKVDKPDAGPVQTKDVADCVMILTHALLGDQISSVLGRTLMEAKLSGSQSGGFTNWNAMSRSEDVFSRLGRGAASGQRPVGVGRPRRSG